MTIYFLSVFLNSQLSGPVTAKAVMFTAQLMHVQSLHRKDIMVFLIAVGTTSSTIMHISQTLVDTAANGRIGEHR